MRYLLIICIVLLTACATTPFENETAAGVRITITFGDNAVVNDITVTTSSDNTQDSKQDTKQDAKQAIPISVDPSSLTPAGAGTNLIKKIVE
jgi:zona occludens toxin (predicted ATPase)